MPLLREPVESESLEKLLANICRQLSVAGATSASDLSILFRLQELPERRGSRPYAAR